MERRTHRRIALFFLWLMLGACQSGPEKNPRADWADVTPFVTGFGPVREWSSKERIFAIQQAKQDALRLFEEKILALRTDSGETLFEKAQKDAAIEKKIFAYVRGAEVLAMENKPEGIEIKMRLFLGDHFKAALGMLPRKEIPPPHTRPEQSF